MPYVAQFHAFDKVKNPKKELPQFVWNMWLASNSQQWEMCNDDAERCETMSNE